MQVSLNRGAGVVLVMDRALLHSIITVILDARDRADTLYAQTLVLCVLELGRRG